MFLTPLILEAAPNPDYWYVRAPLVWCDPQFGRLEIPSGFTTDLASIPRVLRNLAPFDPNGRSRRAAVPHDAFYNGLFPSITKPTADAFLYVAMIAEGCSTADADAFYEAVHWFGQPAWDAGHARHISGNFDSLASYGRWLQFPLTVSGQHPAADGLNRPALGVVGQIV